VPLGTPAARVYGLGDVVAVRLARDLLGRGIERDVVAAVAAGVADWEPDRWRNWRRIAAEGDTVYVMAGDMDGVEVFRSEGVEPGWPEREEDMLRGWEESDITDTGDGWREIGGDGPMLVYPVSSVAAGIIERVDYWLIGKGIPKSMLAEWL
jgi:hypothetical protein